MDQRPHLLTGKFRTAALKQSLETLIRCSPLFYCDWSILMRVLNAAGMRTSTLVHTGYLLYSTHTVSVSFIHWCFVAVTSVAGRSIQ